MMNTTLLKDLGDLTDAERIQLAQELWDSIPPDSAALEPSDELRRELERRRAAHLESPGSAIPWEEARAYLRQRHGA